MQMIEHAVLLLSKKTATKIRYQNVISGTELRGKTMADIIQWGT